MLRERIKRRRIRRLLKTLAAFAAIGVLAGIWWLVFYSPIFLVRHIEVKDAGALGEDVARLVEPHIFGRSYWIFRKNHPLFLDENFLAAKILSEFSRLGEVKLRYRFLRHALEIAVLERKPVAHWCAADACFLVDRKGVIYAEVPPSEGMLILTIDDQVPRELRVGMKVAPEDWMAFFFEIRERLKPIAWVSSVVVEEESFGGHYVKLQTSEGWMLFVDTQMPAEHIADMLQPLLEKEIREQRKLLAYIDLRLPNRAYYKLR